MPEQLSHSPNTIDRTPDTEELQAHYDLELDENIESGTETFKIPEQSTEPTRTPEQRQVSPAADRIRNAAERIGSILEKRAVSRAHDEALKEYRDRDHSDYVDHVSGLMDNADTAKARDFNRSLLRKEERRSDREDLIDAGKKRLRGFGALALEKSKEAGTIAYGLGIIGSEKAKGAAKTTGLTALGLGVMGYEAASKRVDTAKFRHEMNAGERASARSSKKELKDFDRVEKRDAKSLKKEARQDIRAAKKDDRRFEREMRAKMRSEKWEARINKVAVAYEGKKEAVIVRVENGARHTGEAYRATKESIEATKRSAAEKKRKVGSFALKAQNAGAAALAAGREEFKKK